MENDSWHFAREQGEMVGYARRFLRVSLAWKRPMTHYKWSASQAGVTRNGSKMQQMSLDIS
jgi:hypothetical protein